MSQSENSIQHLWKIKHPMSSGLHFLGFLAAFFAFFYHVFRKDGAIQPSRLGYAYIFLISMALLYLASSLYHLLITNEVITRRLRMLDHAMIYVFIAGTITPFCIAFESPVARLIGILFTWILALSGAGFTALLSGSSRWVRVGAYIALSLFGLVAVANGLDRINKMVLIWLILGCVAYLLGSVVYALKRPNPSPRHFGFHEIWHLFVLIGCACHYVSIESLLASPLP